MFTGIVESVGHIAVLARRGADVRLCVAAPAMGLDQVKIGDSIAVSGVCLTVTEIAQDSFWVDVSAATLSCTTLGRLTVGDVVNLEQAVTPSTRLGGHFVTGHVDGIGVVQGWDQVGDSYRLTIDLAGTLMRYVATKGSICIDGVSLTVNGVWNTGFEVNIIPHTRDVTTFKSFARGRAVNVEIDLVARYVERLLVASARGAPFPAGMQEVS